MSPAFLQLVSPSDDERAVIQQAQDRLSVFSARNREASAYYEGKQTARIYGISIPPSMRDAEVVAGWGGTCVDVLEERLDWQGWTSDGDEWGLSQVFDDNDLSVESGMAHLDALIFGLSFVAVGAGVDGEPSPLVTTHSPNSMTAWWDLRTRRISQAAYLLHRGGELVEATAYFPDQTVTFGFSNGAWTVVDRDEHKMGRVPVVMMPNRVRVSRETGRSEITRAVRYYTDACVRTLLGLEVNREFYNAPQRIGLNMNPEDFVDTSGNPVDQWTSIQGRVWMAPPNGADEPEPKMQQFNPASPAPYLDQVKGYATLLAAEAGIPPAYLGFQTDNPASADAIRAGEARLVKRAERRQASFGRAWREVGALALLIRDGVIPDDYRSSVALRWRDAATPTRAASADEASKLITSGVLPADSSVTYDRVGLSPAEQRQVAADKRRSAGADVLASLTRIGQEPEQADEQDDAEPVAE